MKGKTKKLIKSAMIESEDINEIAERNAAVQELKTRALSGRDQEAEEYFGRGVYSHAWDDLEKRDRLRPRLRRFLSNPDITDLSSIKVSETVKALDEKQKAKVAPIVKKKAKRKAKAKAKIRTKNRSPYKRGRQEART